MTRNIRHPRESGFTLVELLIALTLMAMIGALGLLGYQAVVPAWHRSEARGDAARPLFLAQELIGSLLSQAYPAVIGESGKRYVDFAGSDNAVEFLAPLRQQSGAPVIARYRIDMGEDGTLHIETRLAFGAADGATPPVLQEATVLRGLAVVRFMYFGSDTATEPPRWQTDWRRRKTLPALVRLHLERRDGQPPAWPDLVAAPRVTADADCTFDPADGKCRGQ